MGGVFSVFGAIFAALAVAGGAFAAHALKGVLTPEQVAAFETGIRYQMYHALALLFVGWIDRQGGDVWVRRAGWSFVAGILLFSGSLYVLSLLGLRWAGPITPLGGLAFIAGWVCLALACRSRRRSP